MSFQVSGTRERLEQFDGSEPAVGKRGTSRLLVALLLFHAGACGSGGAASADGAVAIDAAAVDAAAANDAPSIDDAGPCACQGVEGCLGGQCGVPSTLAIVQLARGSDDGTLRQWASYMLGTPGQVIALESGPCRAFSIETIGSSSPAGGTYLLQIGDEPEQMLDLSSIDGRFFEIGEPLATGISFSASAEGGNSIAPFSLQTTLPSLPQALSVGPRVEGMPLQVTWTGAHSSSELLIFAGGAKARCDVSNRESFSVPDEVISALEEPLNSLRIVHYNTDSIEPAAGTYARVKASSYLEQNFPAN